MAEGDKKSRYFYNQASFRHKQNAIWRISNGDGRIITSQSKIQREAICFFSKLYREREEVYFEKQMGFINLFPDMVNEEVKDQMGSPITKGEILGVLKDLARDKSPGLDGWSVELFIHFQDIMMDELFKMVEESQCLCRILGSVNATFIALISKVLKPSTFTDFHPV